MIQSDYLRGQEAARLHGDEPGWSASDESRHFWVGFSNYKREVAMTADPDNLDTYDF